MNTVVFDMDGTLADNRNRFEHLPVEPTCAADWLPWHLLAGSDEPIAGMITLAQILSQQHRIVVLTARCDTDEMRDITETWLRTHGVPVDELILMPFSETSMSEWKTKVIAGLDNVVLAIDDMYSNCLAFAANGIPYVHVTRPGGGK